MSNVAEDPGGHLGTILSPENYDDKLNYGNVSRDRKWKTNLRELQDAQLTKRNDGLNAESERESFSFLTLHIALLVCLRTVFY